MVEEILPGMYRMEIDLPGSPLKATNSYLIRGQERCLIVDTGFNREECMNDMLSCLHSLNVDLKDADFFVTHLHADHLGLVGELATDSSKVYFNQGDAPLANPGREYWEQLGAFFKTHGFPQEAIEGVVKRHPGRVHGPKRDIDFSILKQDDRIDVGDYSFSCIETPGHTPGHMCLYEADRKVLLCGDHILFDITPNITTWPCMRDSLGQYLRSLDKVRGLDVGLVLPGHRGNSNDHRKRIAELQEHHRARLGEVAAALEDGEKTAFQVAPWVTWDIQISSWESFPMTQKVFAVGETLAHLEYLEGEGSVRRNIENGIVVFSLR